MITPINEKLHSLYEEKYRVLEEKNAVKGYWEYRNNWVKYPENHIVTYPLNIDIELTNCCNLKCVMCPSTIYGYENKGYMSERLFTKIIDEASEIGVPAVKLIWRGESLLHPNIIDFIKYAKSKGIIDVLLNTNATLLTPEMSEQIIRSGLDKLYFSFDSPYKEKYESIRIGASFDDVLENIISFHNIRNRIGSDSPITRVSLVKMTQDEKELEDYINLFQAYVDCITYTDAFYLEKEPQDQLMEQVEKREFCCPMLWQRLVISWEGLCYPCCRDEMELYCIGDSNVESIKDIWKSKKLEALRLAHTQGTWDKYRICNICQKSVRPSNTRSNGMI